MVSSNLKQAAGFMRKQKNSKRWQKGFWCLAIAVAVGTVAILTLTGQALTHKTKLLNCQLEVHEHTEDCYDEEDNLICGYADYVVHVHNDDCYDSEGNLVCTLPEIEEHEHTEDCYEEQQVLICEAAEAAGEEGHTHTEECYSTEQSQAPCDKEEHTHDDSCYESTQTLTCDQEEHSHGDGCYDENGEVICEQEEHSHGDDCYEKTSEMICGKEEHTHDDSCAGAEERVLICGKDESESVAGHTHTEECYRTEKVLVCGELELHTHEEALVEDGGCYEEDAFDEETGEFIEGSLPICGLLQLEEHTHGEDCFEVVELSEEEIDHLNQTFTKTYDGESFKVTAEYTADAKIPAEAELIAEQIAADSEHYAQREAEYKEKLEDENASMHALLKVGFYVNGEEIEPESDVTLTVQFLDENGLAEGSPITVVHFAEDGAEVLSGSEVENGSTTFRMDSFSEIAIGYQPSQNGGVYISQAFQYQDEAYTITFRVQGEAVPAEGEEPLPEGVTEIVSDQILPVVSKMSTSVENTEPAEPGEEGEDVPPAGEGEETSPVEGSQDADESADGNEVTAPVEGDDNIESAEGREDGTSADDAQDELPEREPEVSEGETGENQDNTEEVIAEEVITEEINPVEMIRFRLEQMSEDSAEYAAYAAYAENKDDGSQQIRLQVMKYEVTFGDIQLDLSDCKVTAEIKPTQNLLDFAETGISEAAFIAENEGAEEGNQEVMLSALQMAQNEEVTESGAMLVGNEEDDPDKEEIIYVEINGETIGINLKGTPNPHFTVQYYARIDRVSSLESGSSTSVPVINTSTGREAESKDPAEGGNFPKNGDTNPPLLYMQLESNGNVKYEKKLTKIYKDDPSFTYYRQPTIEYLNAPIKDTQAAENYELAEIWILKENGDVNSESVNDWKKYIYSKDLHLTNREGDDLAAEGTSSGYVYIADQDIVRLVYETKSSDDKFPAAFYDYDISNGYTTNGKTKTMITSAKDNTGVWRGFGINSMIASTTPGGFAFGNANAGTNLHTITWNKNRLNQANTTAKGSEINTYMGCTFGLVDGVKKSAEGDGITVRFSSGVQGPEIFGTKKETGKTQYPGNLTFKRNGDTYTLSGTLGTGKDLTGLDNFTHPAPEHTKIWTNNFWPMDKQQNEDMHFGKSGEQKYQKFGDGVWDRLPPSDDGVDHNSYFGLAYEIDFELVKNYVGPLEYYFFGDDDMWVFLDAGTSNQKLICDIGGVHSSVGEYVNLWDYLSVNTSDTSEQHKLSFFYTERGASGSTCWMQFTLPAVSGRQISTDDNYYGELRVEKSVTKYIEGKKPVSYDTGDEFVFSINLTDANGKNLADDYSFTKYNADNEIIEYSLVLRNNSVFTLKNGEYIIINHLPAGTRYTIVEQEKILKGEKGDREQTNSDYVYDTDIEITELKRVEGQLVPVEGKDNPKTLEDRRGASDTIPGAGQSKVHYTNEFRAYALPKTGGSGVSDYTAPGVILTLIAAAFCFGYLRRKNIRGDGL